MYWKMFCVSQKLVIALCFVMGLKKNKTIILKWVCFIICFEYAKEMYPAQSIKARLWRFMICLTSDTIKM